MSVSSETLSEPLSILLTSCWETCILLASSAWVIPIRSRSSTSFSAVILVGGTLILGYPLPVLPAQILWTNIVEGGLRLRLEIKAKTGINKRDIKEGDVIRVTGLLDKTQLGFRLLPRSTEDVEKIKTKQAAPSLIPAILGESESAVQETMNDLDFSAVQETVEYTGESNEQSIVYKYLIAALMLSKMVLPSSTAVTNVA